MWSISLQDAHAHRASMSSPIHPITAAGRGVSHDNGGRTMNERSDGRRDTSEYVGLNRNGFQTPSVLRLRDNCWVYTAARHVAEAAVDRRAGTFVKRVGNIHASLKLDCGSDAWIEVNSALMGLWRRWQVQTVYFCDSNAAPFIHNLSSAVRTSRRYTSYLTVLCSTQTCFRHFCSFVHQCCLILG